MRPPKLNACAGCDSTDDLMHPIAYFRLIPALSNNPGHKPPRVRFTDRMYCPECRAEYQTREDVVTIAKETIEKFGVPGCWVDDVSVSYVVSFVMGG